MAKLGVTPTKIKFNPMLRKVTFYWILLTLILVDSWLLSKPNILGKIGLIVYKYHYLRSFPRTLLTVWIVVSTSILLVLLVQYLMKQKKLTKRVTALILGACVIASVLIMVKVYIDFTAWSYSHSGAKFKYGAYLLPFILVIVFTNGLVQVLRTIEVIEVPKESQEELPLGNILPPGPGLSTFNHDTSLP